MTGPAATPVSISIPLVSVCSFIVFLLRPRLVHDFGAGGDSGLDLDPVRFVLFVHR